MNKNNRMGGARVGAGAPHKFAPRKREMFILERPFRQLELLEFVSVEDDGNSLVFRCGNDIIAIRRPEPGEIATVQPAAKGEKK